MTILGVGSWFRGDDAAGLLVARELARRGVPALEFAGDLTRLLDQWAGCERVILIDAFQGDGPAGTIHHFDPSSVRFAPGAFRYSSHGIGVPEAIELSLVLGNAPSQWEIYAIEGEYFEQGSELSPAVQRAVDSLSETLCARAEAGFPALP